MNQRFSMAGDIDNLTVELDVKENGKWIYYRFELEPDRSTCLITREVFDGERVTDTGDVNEPQSHENWIRTLEEAKDDNATFTPAVIWILRGMWGIPLG